VNKQRFQHVGFSFVNLNASVFLVFFVTNTSFVNEDCTQTTLLIRTQSAQRRHNVHKEFEKIRRVLCGSWCSLWPIPRA